MGKNTLMLVAIGILFLTALFLTYKVSSITGDTISAGKMDTTGWTANEIMNYEMHGTIPARVQSRSSSGSAGSGMVGGC